MKIWTSILAGTAVFGCFDAARAAAPAAPGPLPTTTVGDNQASRAIDCHGGDLLVSGSGNTLTTTGCPSIAISGSSNHIRVQFDGPGFITASGNNNNVRWAPGPEHLSTHVSSTGSGNEINPVMSDKDLQPSPIEAAGLKPR